VGSRPQRRSWREVVRDSVVGVRGEVGEHEQENVRDEVAAKVWLRDSENGGKRTRGNEMGRGEVEDGMEATREAEDGTEATRDTMKVRTRPTSSYTNGTLVSSSWQAA
jgi:hypothetical protein